MPWVRLDDGFAQHPKVVGVGPLGIAMQVAGLCYAAHYLTDGFIPHAAVPTLMDFSELDEHAFNGLGSTCWRAVQKLVDAGMWEEAEGGYLIHDYLDYQPSKATVLKERTDAQERMRRLRSGDVHPNNERNSEEVHDTRTRTRTQSSYQNSLNPPVSPPLPGGTPPATEKNVGETLGATTEPEPPTQSKPKKPRPSTTPRAAPAVSEDFRREMVERWSGQVDDVGEEITRALAHKAAHKYDDPEPYVRNWLRREAGMRAQARSVPLASPDGLRRLTPSATGPPGRTRRNGSSQEGGEGHGAGRERDRYAGQGSEDDRPGGEGRDDTRDGFYPPGFVAQAKRELAERQQRADSAQQQARDHG